MRYVNTKHRANLPRANRAAAKYRARAEADAARAKAAKEAKTKGEDK